MSKPCLTLVTALLLGACASPPAPPAADAPAAVPKGEVTEGPSTHTANSLRDLVREAQVALPASATEFEAPP